MVLCIKCQQPVKNVPTWFAGFRARFVCETCRQQKAVDFQTVLNNIWSKVQEDITEDLLPGEDLGLNPFLEDRLDEGESPIPDEDPLISNEEPLFPGEEEAA